MKKILRLCTKALLISAISILMLSGAALADDNIINMVVSPNVLNLDSSGSYIHIHTDISYGLIEDTTVEVNGEEIVGIETFADDCGNLVVKFDMYDVKIILDDGEEWAEFVLTCNDGLYTDDDSVPVIQPPTIQPPKKP